MQEHMARPPMGAPVAEWPNRLSQNESGTHFSPTAAKRQNQTLRIGRTAPLTTAEPHLNHAASQLGCYNGNILHATSHQTRPPVFFEDDRSARPPVMRLTCMPLAHVPALRLRQPSATRCPVDTKHLAHTCTSCVDRRGFPTPGTSFSHLRTRRLHDSPAHAHPSPVTCLAHARV